jgi:SAM-dependent methyltransferase
VAQAEGSSWLKGTDESAQAAYFEGEVAHHRPASHPVVEGFARQRWHYLERLMALDEVDTALDAGCGSGFSTLYAPEHLNTVGCDRSLSMLSQTRRRNSLCASVNNLPFADDSFDLAYCWEVLHHIEEPHRALAEMARVSRRFVVVFEPNPVNLAQFLFSLYDPEHRWVLRYTAGYVRAQVEAAGLRVHRHVRGGLIFPNKTPGWLFPLLSRLPYRVPLIGISHVVIAEKG